MHARDHDIDHDIDPIRFDDTHENFRAHKTC